MWNPGSQPRQRNCLNPPSIPEVISNQGTKITETLESQFRKKSAGIGINDDLTYLATTLRTAGNKFRLVSSLVAKY